MTARRLAFAGSMLALAGPLLAALACTPGQRAADVRGVHVVLFVIDTLRADRVGAYGHPRRTTPHLDALAADGVVFEQAYAPAPWTLPSVVSLMTSSPLCEHGVYLEGRKIGDDVEPLAQRMAAAGYVTGSFFANPYAGPMTGLDRGFATTELSEQVDGERIAEWLDGVGERPFFLYVHNVEPHDPYAAPVSMLARLGISGDKGRLQANRLLQEYRSLTRVDFIAGRQLGATDNSPRQQAVMRHLGHLKTEVDAFYDADVSEADDRLGGVIRVLEQRNLWQDTLFVLVADHGEELGEHGGWQHDQSLYEELVRVPMILRFPGGELAGRRVRDVVSLLDVMPTVLDFLELPEPAAGGSGRSLMPLVRGDGMEATNGARVTSVRYNRKKYFRPYKESRGDFNIALRQGDWKGIWNVEVDSFELYDLGPDPAEQVDVSAEHPERVEGMRAEATAWYRRSCRDWDREAASPPASELDEQTRRRLQALGYLDP